MKGLVLYAAFVATAAVAAQAEPRVVELQGKSPLVTIRFVFTTGAASDPADKPGLASLTAQMLGNSGTKSLTYKQITRTLSIRWPPASRCLFR